MGGAGMELGQERLLMALCECLRLFESEDSWLLVPRQLVGSGAGLVPSAVLVCPVAA